ncbi:BlaI/MecI/CopY family transcriptional regulator [Tahibacter caeni]|uniref:BlaI/MecI/CopY family transcriptional regulator n=1 Tax=Tahibacter caeni TaxID=1453545 RepID=UPI00214770D5|nr:BlaI/MecI/CopY family transcriptional regulator [Tahibacter caeni]
MPISEAESAVMQVLWARHPLSAEEIVTALGDARQWQEATVKTLLNRLLNKGAVGAVKEGRRYLYSPLLQREAYVHEQSKDLLDRLFGGRLAPLVAHFSAHETLSPRDIAELKRLIAELPDER